MSTKEYTARPQRLRKLLTISILSALAAVVMIFEFPLGFAPGFYLFDFSELIVLIGGLAYGPLAAFLIELFKVLLNTLFNQSATMYVGELANIIVGCALTVPASAIYRKYRTKKGMLAGLAVGTATITVVGALINYFVLLPAFAYFFKCPVEDFIAQGTKIIPLIKDLKTFVLLATAPFNLVKGIIVSLLTFMIYPRIKDRITTTG